MKTIEKQVNKLTKQDFSEIIESLKRGEVVVLPTDTIYGISCLAKSEEAVNKVFKVKKRDKNKPLIILVSSLAMAKEYVSINNKKQGLLKEIWQNSRPTTVILAGLNNLPQSVYAEDDSLSIRLPKSDFLIKIIKSLGSPIISTSLNLSGEENINEPSLLKKYPSFAKHLDLVVDTGKGRKKLPSRIVDIRGDKIKIIR